MNYKVIRPQIIRGCAAAIVVATVGFAAMAQNTGQATRPATKDPGPSPTLWAQPPKIDENTVVLFDGESWTGWRKRDGTPSQWEVQADGSVLVKGGDAITEMEFRDCQLHVEFLCPLMADRQGQGRANSGVYLHGRYEVQVLDSFGLEPGPDDCGAIYSVAPPLFSVCRPPETWQTYDIVFRAPRFGEDGQLTEPPCLTVMHNGVIIQNAVPVPHPTRAGLDNQMPQTGPLMLQDHGNPVRYRNIWLRKLN